MTANTNGYFRRAMIREPELFNVWLQDEQPEPEPTPMEVWNRLNCAEAQLEDWLDLGLDD